MNSATNTSALRFGVFFCCHFKLALWGGAAPLFSSSYFLFLFCHLAATPKPAVVPWPLVLGCFCFFEVNKDEELETLLAMVGSAEPAVDGDDVVGWLGVDVSKGNCFNSKGESSTSEIGSRG
jgi:hypothetical protein